MLKIGRHLDNRLGSGPGRWCLALRALAEVTGVYELQEKGNLRRLSVTELKGIGSLQFTLYVEAGDFTGSMMGLADLEGEQGHL